MRTFNECVSIVLSRMRELQYADESMRKYERFYDELDGFLEGRSAEYSPRRGAEFLLESCFQSKSSILMEKSAIAKLDDVFETGEVKGTHISVMKIVRSAKLSPVFEKITEDFIASVAENFSPGHIPNIRRRCHKFLKFMLARGKKRPKDFDYEDIMEFHRALGHMQGNSRIVEESSVKSLLLYMADVGMTGRGLPLYLGIFGTEKEGLYARISGDNGNALPGCTKGNAVISIEFKDKVSEIIKVHENAGYVEGYVETLTLAADLLFLFFDINDTGFHLGMARKWIRTNEFKKNFSRSSRQAMLRILYLFESYISTGDVCYEETRPKGVSGLDKLPQWCRAPLEKFAQEKSQEKLEETTVKNYLYSCIRFCDYIIGRGLESFSDVDSSVLMDFNLYDRHCSSEGKNSCNHRIRKFLKSLYRQGLTDKANLYNALSTSWAESEYNTVILNSGERETVKAYVLEAQTPIALRNSAILLLGSEMGLRGCDIVKLKLEDIDWKSQSVSFLQDKTDAAVRLFMPASVGNAIYRYLKNARPKESRSRHVFVRTTRPYSRLTRSACYTAIKKVLPDRDVTGSGFHVTRKTFATQRLRDSVKPDMISAVMGQSDRKSLTPYLSLDTERMKTCPLSLADLVIGGEAI